MSGRGGGAADMRVVGVQALVVSIALIAFAWVPPMPVAGAQLSDVIGAAGVGLVLLVARRELAALARVPVGAFALYAVWAALACGATHGSWARVAGVWWLVALALGVYAAAAESEEARTRVRKALAIAGVIGGLVGLVGAALFFAGVTTPLLNHPGDLVPGDYPRIRGTLQRANGLAGLISVSLFFVRDLDVRWRKPAYGVLLLALVFTFSRTWLALAGTLAVTHFALAPGRTSRARDALAIGAAVATVAVMLVVSWATVKLDPSHPWRVGISSAPGSRWYLVRNALDNIAAHPVFGVGPGRLAGGYRQAHFTALDVSAVFGVPAVLAFIAGMVATMRMAWNRARAGDVAARALVSSIVVVAFDSLARDVEDQRPLWIVVGLVFACARVSSRPAEPAQPRRR